MEFIGRVGFGVETQSQTNPNDEFKTLAGKVLSRLYLLELDLETVLD